VLATLANIVSLSSTITTMTSHDPKELSPRAREIAAAALVLLEEEGPDGLSMRRLAERLGIRAPSIYKHLPDKQALESAIVSAGFELQAEVFERAVRNAKDPLVALARAYRKFAKAHPHLYRLMTERELQRDQLAPGVERRAGLTIYEAVGRDADLARAAWAFAHGMTILELDSRFPPDANLDAAWERGIQAFRR
jgi:AcrR family transcriptional regulator